MSQGDEVLPLEATLGYVLKQAATALHGAMDAALRPCGLTVSQYSCLELLHREPDQSSAQLARGAFVSAQSMNELLHGLQGRGLVVRPLTATRGRARPIRLTPSGRAALQRAQKALVVVENQLAQAVPESDHQRLVSELHAIFTELT